MDVHNTLNGTIGFSVELADGRTFTEADGYWDDVPKNVGVVRVSLVRMQDGYGYTSLDGCTRYFFGNETTGTWRGCIGLAAKIIGGIKDGQATVRRLVTAADGNHHVESYSIDADQLKLAEHAYRNA